MTEQVLKVLGKLDEWNTRSIIWVTLEYIKCAQLFKVMNINEYFNKYC